MAREITALAIKSGLHRDLGLDSTATEFNEEEISKIENFAEEIASEKITGQLYSMGSPYEHERIISSVKAMSEDPIAYNMYFIDKAKGMAPASLADNKALFRQKYLIPAEKLVDRILKDKAGIIDTDKLICEYASVSMEDMEKAEKIKQESIAPKGMEAMIQAMMQQQSGKAASEGKAGEKPAGEADGTNASGMQKMMKAISSIDKQDLKEIMSIASGMDMNSAAAIMKTAHSGKDIKTSADSIIAALPEKDREAAGKIIALLSGTDKRHAGDAAAKGGKPAGKAQGMAHKSSRQPLTKQEKELYMAIADLRSSVSNIRNYKKALEESPEAEFKTLLNSLDGGYTAPSPGGDIIANPNTLPTGRNMFAINAEATPSETAWEKGVALAKNTISMYRKRHGGEYPRKVSYTLWSGEFIETEGATIAQILYMLGVEPLRDTYGRVTDLRLIPSEDLGRPRIDVVVQTSGQLRDIAASRLFLISKAVEMAAAASDDSFENNVKEVIITCWKDDGSESSLFGVLPTLAYAAEYARGNFDEKKARRFYRDDQIDTVNKRLKNVNVLDEQKAITSLIAQMGFQHRTTTAMATFMNPFFLKRSGYTIESAKKMKNPMEWFVEQYSKGNWNVAVQEFSASMERLGESAKPLVADFADITRSVAAFIKTVAEFNEENPLLTRMNGLLITVTSLAPAFALATMGFKRLNSAVASYKELQE